MLVTDNVLGKLPSLPPDSVVAIFLGPMVMGIMIEQLLLGIICSLAVTYFRYHFSSDSFFCRWIVTCLVAFTVLLGILDFMALYRSLAFDYGDVEKFDVQGWVSWTEPGLTAWIAFIAHIFYIFRCWAVTHSLVICIFLGVVALNSLVSGITAAVFCFSLGRLSKLPGAIVPSIIWFASNTICDLGIATILVLYLWRGQSVLRSSHTMISRLRRTSVETGSLTAICAITNLILFAAMPEKGYDMMIHYSMSHLYTLSVLYTLLDRQNLRNLLREGSGTFVSDIRSSFLTAGVLSAVCLTASFKLMYSHLYDSSDIQTSLDNDYNSETPRLRNKTSNLLAHNEHISWEQSHA